MVSIVRTDDIGALLELEFEWSDVFDIDISPAVSAEEGLRIGPEVYGRLAACSTRAGVLWAITSP